MPFIPPVYLGISLVFWLAVFLIALRVLYMPTLSRKPRDGSASSQDGFVPSPLGWAVIAFPLLMLGATLALIVYGASK